MLEGIFGGQLTSVKELLRHPLFADVVPKEDLTDVSPPLSSTEKDLLKSAKKGVNTMRVTALCVNALHITALTVLSQHSISTTE